MAFHIYNYPFLKDLNSPLSSASLYPPQRLPTRATSNHLLCSNNNNSKILGVNSGKRKCVSVRVQTTERRAMPEDKMSIIAKEITLLEFELNTGAKIPSVGLGTWQSESGIVGQAVEKAIKVGYRHIDCARSYGNEKEIGSVLKKLFDDEVVKRDDLFITSKLWCTDHAPEVVPVALDKTLEDLQLDYLDLYLIHWPARLRKGAVGMNPEDFVPVDIPTTWKAMEALYDSGKARAIGICNVSTKKLGDLLDLSRIPPAVVQVECHPVWQQTKLLEFCKSKGVHLTGYSPLGSPGTAMYKSDVLKHPVVITTAEKLGKTPAQVALRWGLQMGHSVLPKSTNESRIKENFDVFDWSIPDELFAKFSEIDQERQVTGDFFVHEKFGSYRTVEDIWDGEL